VARWQRTSRRTDPQLLRAWLPLLVWLGALSVGVALFHALGAGPLAAPPVTEPGAWGAWANEREPAVATVAVLRLLVLGLAWYLVGVTTVGIVARLARAASLVRVADALTVPVVRRFLQGALGLGLATAMVGAVAPGVHRAPTATSAVAAGAAASEAAADEVRLARASDDEVRSARVAGDAVRLVRAPIDEDELARVASAPLPLELLEGEDGGDEVTMRQVAAGGEADATPPGAQHEVVAGESLWTIARDALTSSIGGVPPDGTLHGYWLDLIEHNRGRLADPDNPDLIFPGQPLELPPLPGSAGGAAAEPGS
jgi:LysM repeat protein